MGFSNQKPNIFAYKNFYRSIGSVRCLYFNNEQVFFNRKGFNHLLRRGRDERSYFDQINRLNLLKYCKIILSAKHNDVEYRIIRRRNTVAQFWGFKAHFEKSEIKLVVRQIDRREKHFFSIFRL